MGQNDMDTSTRIDGMDGDYLSFVARKAVRAKPSGIEPGPMHDALFDYQKDVVAFCLRQGRAALFLDTGLGKSACTLEWCDQAAKASNGFALILTPLAVAKQFEREAAKFGYEAHVVRDQSEVRRGINVCNYDRIDKLDPSAFGAVALDESSILKNMMGKTTRALIDAFSGTRFRLCATATPAPNDHTELGQHAEFLGVMTAMEMRARWFINDTGSASQDWRLKRAAVNPFWDWVASWARAAETPADLGYDASRFILPKLRIHRHKTFGEMKAAEGSLFAADMSATNIFSVKRETSEARADMVASLVAKEPGEPWLIWCDIDAEADALKSRLPNAVEVRGSMSPERKEEGIEQFLTGQVSLISKPSVCGAGLNFQHCARVAYVGRTFSYESFYQSVRRCWRFGQTRPVDVHLVVAGGEDQIGRVIDRKADDHKTMKRAMADAMKRNIGAVSSAKIKYNPQFTFTMPSWY